jgi:hypothetical protein
LQEENRRRSSLGSWVVGSLGSLRQLYPFSQTQRLLEQAGPICAGELSHPWEKTAAAINFPMFKEGFLKPGFRLTVFIYISHRNIFSNS